MFCMFFLIIMFLYKKWCIISFKTLGNYANNKWDAFLKNNINFPV